MGTKILAMIDMLGLPIIKVVSTPCSQWQNYFCDIYIFFNINLSLDERGHVRKKYFLTIKKLTFEHFLKIIHPYEYRKDMYFLILYLHI